MVLEARVEAHYLGKELARMDKERKDKQGSGMRGDKIRTYREQDDMVSDHRSEKKCRQKSLRSGDFGGCGDNENISPMHTTSL